MFGLLVELFCILLFAGIFWIVVRLLRNAHEGRGSSQDTGYRVDVPGSRSSWSDRSEGTR